MALSPEISLNAGKGITQFNPLEASSGALNLVNLMQKLDVQPQMLQTELKLKNQEAQQRDIALRYQEPNAIAALQTAQQSAEEKRRELSTQRAFSQAIRAGVKVDKGTGKITLPSDEQVINHLAENNELDIIDPKAMYSYLTSGSTTRQNAESAKQSTIKTETDLTDFINKRADLLDTYARAVNDPEKIAQMAGAFAKANQETAVRALGPEAGAVAQDVMKQRYGDMSNLVRPDGSPDPKKFGSQLKLVAEANARSRAINPLNAETLAQNWEGIAQNAAQNYTSPEWRTGTADTNSKVKAFADSLIAAGIAKPEDVKGLTGKAIYDRFGAAAQQNLPTGRERTQMGVEAADLSAVKSKFDSALALSDKITKEFPTKIGSIGVAAWEKYVASNPTVGGPIQGAINEYNRRNPGRDLSFKEGWPTVRDALLQESNALSKQVGARTSFSTSTGSAGAAKDTGQTSTPGAPAPTVQTSTAVGKEQSFRTPQGDKITLIKIKVGPDSDKSTWKQK